MSQRFGNWIQAAANIPAGEIWRPEIVYRRRRAGWYWKDRHDMVSGYAGPFPTRSAAAQAACEHHGFEPPIGQEEGYCDNEFCENEAGGTAGKTVRVSVNRAGDQTRRLCNVCENAYSIGVQHGRYVQAEQDEVEPDREHCKPVDRRKGRA